MNNNPMKGNNIKIYNLDKYLIYEGDLLEGLYDNHGKVYDKYGTLIYEGGLSKGKYNKYGKLYKSDGKVEYEGEFLNGKYHGYGKLIGKYEGYFVDGLYEGEGTKYEETQYTKAIFTKGIINDNNAKVYKYSCLGNYLYFEGSIKNDKYDGFGNIYHLNKNLYYQGNFKDGNISGKGIKYYENGFKKIEGIFDTINKCQGIYYDPKGIKIYEGEIMNDIPFNANNIIIYNDNTNKIYQGDIKDGKYEGFGKEYCSLISDKILYEGTFKNNYYIDHNLSNYENKTIKILVTSYQRGYHSCEFVEKLITGKVGSFSSFTEGEKTYNFEYNENKFSSKIRFVDDLYKRQAAVNIFYGKSSKIFIFVIDINKEDKIDEKYILDSLKSKNPELIVYIVAKDIEKCEDEGKFINFRNQAKDLINNGIINKYFELSLRTDEGFENCKKNLIIDSALLSKHKIDELKTQESKSSISQKEKLAKCIIY